MSFFQVVPQKRLNPNKFVFLHVVLVLADDVVMGLGVEVVVVVVVVVVAEVEPDNRQKG